MSKKLLFVTIASIAVGNAFADIKTLTTRDYVDTADALKQDKIAANDDELYPQGSVVATTDVAGVVSYRGVCNDPDVDGCNDSDLVTLELLDNRTDLQETTVTTKSCYLWADNSDQTDDSDCLLWELIDTNVASFSASSITLKEYGETASFASECASGVLANVIPTYCGCASSADCHNKTCNTSTHTCSLKGL